MNFISLATNVVLSIYICWEVIAFVPRYHRLKQQIANGDPKARTRVYQRVLIFEWISAALALLALRLDWSKLNPKSLGLEGAKFMHVLALPEGASKSAVLGLFIGAVFGGIGFAIAMRRRNRRGQVQETSASSGWRSRILPDFTALIPVTTRERLLYSVVAVSAGICEEIVFRGWLLSTLHSPVGLMGAALVLVSAVIFGLAHIYQKAVGAIVTAVAGLLFCVLYVTTGSLVAPILLHTLVDIRFAFMPAPKTATPKTAYA